MWVCTESSPAGKEGKVEHETVLYFSSWISLSVADRPIIVRGNNTLLKRLSKSASRYPWTQIYIRASLWSSPPKFQKKILFPEIEWHGHGSPGSRVSLGLPSGIFRPPPGSGELQPPVGLMLGVVLGRRLVRVTCQGPTEQADGDAQVALLPQTGHSLYTISCQFPWHPTLCHRLSYQALVTNYCQFLLIGHVTLFLYW